TMRTGEDVGDMVPTAATMTALISNDPMLKRSTELKLQIDAMMRQKQAHERNQFEANTAKASLPGKIEAAKKDIEEKQTLTDYREKNKPAKFAMSLNGAPYESAGQAGMELLRLGHEQRAGQPPQNVGQYAGFDVLLAHDPMADHGVFYL